MLMDKSRLIFKCEFGSTIYGTSTPTSDQDYKAIYLPTKKDILLQRAKHTTHQDTKKSSDIKNSKDDVDFEIFSLQQYLKLLCESQTVSLDMLFVPEKHIIQSSYQFNFIKKNKEKFLHKQVGAFYHYAKAQAAKYGVKGFRVGTLRRVIEVLETMPAKSQLKDHPLVLNAFMAHKDTKEYANLITIEGANNKLETYFEVCNRKFQLVCTIEYTLKALKEIFSNYGQRALLAEKNEGIDWKATSHAVRVAREAEELLLTGNITFPCPEAKLLLAIKKGELPYKEVEALIEEGLARIDTAKEKSTLREKPDLEFADTIVYNYYDEVCENE